MSGAGSTGPTRFPDDILHQVVNVADLIRRARTFAQHEGIFTAILQNVHPGAGTITTQVRPYSQGIGVIAPYPDPVPQGFDVWLLSAATRQTAGTGTFTGALILDYAAKQQGFGEDNAGAAVVGDGNQTLVFWDSVITQTTEMGLQEDGKPWARIGIRLPRAIGAGLPGLRFSSTASAASTFQCHLVLGLFPVGMGQDAAL